MEVRELWESVGLSPTHTQQQAVGGFGTKRNEGRCFVMYSNSNSNQIEIEMEIGWTLITTRARERQIERKKERKVKG